MSILIGLLFGDSEALISELCYVRLQLDFWKLATACLLFSAPGMEKSSAPYKYILFILIFLRLSNSHRFCSFTKNKKEKNK